MKIKLLLCLLLLVSGCGEDAVSPSSTVTIRVEVTPEGLDAPWSILGPSLYTNSGVGEALLVDLPAGDYMISWGQVEGYETPDTEQKTISAGGEYTFDGIYIDMFTSNYPFPDTKEQLLANFKTAYKDMDIDEYRECLSENSEFIFTAEDADQFEIPNGYFERAEDLDVMERTFSGNSHVTPYGVTQPGLQSITISNWNNAGI